jgi:fatty acid desaturase
MELAARGAAEADRVASRREYYWAPPHALRGPLLRLLKDSRDAPMLYLLLNVALFTLPGAWVVVAARSHAVGLLFWLGNTLLFQERFLLCMHFHAHRGLFRHRWLDGGVRALLSPFFGVPCGLYYLHHVVMHHTEGNRAGRDLSSTEPYQRDRLLHFLMYWLRFVALIWFELPAYALKTRRYGLAWACAACTVGGMLGVGALLRTAEYRHGATWLLLVPTLVNSLPLMWGNWCQHLFIDPKRTPRTGYHMAYNVIQSACNQRTFNDGYHVEHHLNARAHWSELPERFVAHLACYAQEDAVVFRNIDVFGVGWLVFRGQYDRLIAEHYVALRPRSPRAIEALLRARLKPIL